MGKTPTRSDLSYWQNGSYDWISISDLNTDRKYISDTKERITTKAVRESGIKKIPANTVIMSFKLSIGKTAITSHDMFSNEAIMAFIDRKVIRINPDYIYYLLHALDWNKRANKAVKGRTVNKKIISQTQVNIPDYQTQLRIVKIMDSTRKRVKIQKDILSKLDTLIKARFVEMFGDPICNSKNKSTTKFINVVKLQRGFDLPIRKRNTQGKIPVYGSNGVLGYHDEFKASSGIITGRSGTIGKVYYENNEFWPLNTALFSVKTYGNNIIYLKYLVSLFKLERFCNGAGVPTLNRNDVHKQKIIDIPIKEQNKFASFVQQVDKSKVAIQKSLDETQILFDSLMQKYFS